VAKFRAVVDGTTYYPSLGLLVDNGDVVDLPSDVVVPGLIVVEPALKKAAKIEADPETVVEPDTTAKEV